MDLNVIDFTSFRDIILILYGFSFKNIVINEIKIKDYSYHYSVEIKKFCASQDEFPKKHTQRRCINNNSMVRGQWLAHKNEPGTMKRGLSNVQLNTLRFIQNQLLGSTLKFCTT